MLVFAMGLYGLFITNTSANVNPSDDRAIKGSSLFGMFALKVIANHILVILLFFPSKDFRVLFLIAFDITQMY